MRWFKHLTSARNDEVLSEMVELYGAESYGVWWIILELIGAQMDKTNKCFVRYSVKKWAKSCHVSVKKFQKVVSFLSEFGKISTEFCEKNSDFLIIECGKLLELRDEYSKKSRQAPDKIPTVSSVTPDQETETEVDTDTDKKKSKVFDAESIEMKLSEYLHKVLLKSEPDRKEPNFQNWCKDFDLLIRVDEKRPADIQIVINYAHDPRNSSDSFSWIPNLRSPKKIRKQFTTIFLQSKQQNNSQSTSDYLESLLGENESESEIILEEKDYGTV